MRSSYLPPTFILAALGLAGWVVFLNFRESPAASSTDNPEVHGSGQPAHVTPIPDTHLMAVVLTERAASRLGIATAPVRTTAGTTQQAASVVPYAAVLYDDHGETWVYTNPEPLLYVRHTISVDRITGDQVMLSSGPPVGTAVVTTGAAELFGVEFGIGK